MTVVRNTMTVGSVRIMIKEGFHIQSNEVDDEYIIPTKLEVMETDLIQLIDLEYPEGKAFKLEGSNIILDVFDGVIEIKFKIETAPQISTGEHQLDARLHYQACDDKSCFAPRDIEFSIPIEIIN